MRNKKIVVSPYVFPGLKETPKLSLLYPQKAKRKKMNQEEILEIIAEEFAISASDILSSSHKRLVVDARYVFFAIMKLKNKKSLIEIGKLSSNRDHTTVIHGLKTFKNRYDTEVDYKNSVNLIFSMIGVEYDGRNLTAAK
jgi:chromosomal replication initiation ATPase DnaA